MCRLVRLLMMRLPGRRLVLVGDSGYGTHEVARFVHRHRERLALVSKLHPEANLFDPPPPYRGIGRPRVKGGRRPKPARGGRGGPTASAARRRLVRRRDPARFGRHRGGPLVQGRRRSGPGPLGPRPRPGGHAPRRVLLHDRPGHGPGGDRHPLRGPVEHRMYLPGGTGLPPIGDDAGPVPAHGLAGGPVPVRALLGRRLAVPRAARVEAIRRRALARQGRRDVLGPALCSVRLWIWAEGVFPRAGGRFGLEKLPDFFATCWR